MQIKMFTKRLENLCVAHKISVDVGVKFGNDFVDLVSESSDTEARSEARAKLRQFYEEHGHIEADVDDLCSQFGLKKSNADRQWLRHQIRVLQVTYTPTANAAD
jgi:hypothetical protein